MPVAIYGRGVTSILYISILWHPHRPHPRISPTTLAFRNPNGYLMGKEKKKPLQTPTTPKYIYYAHTTILYCFLQSLLFDITDLYYNC